MQLILNIRAMNEKLLHTCHVDSLNVFYAEDTNLFKEDDYTILHSPNLSAFLETKEEGPRQESAKEFRELIEKMTLFIDSNPKVILFDFRIGYTIIRKKRKARIGLRVKLMIYQFASPMMNMLL